MQVALVQNSNTSHITIVEDGNYRLDLPDGTQVSPVEIGWIGTTYRICELNEARIPTYVESVNIQDSGTGYTNTNILTISGGTAVGNVAQIQVNAIGANGRVSSLIVSNSGYYTSNPDLDNHPTGGTGSGLGVVLTMTPHDVTSVSYTYSANTNEVTQILAYETPVIDNTISLEKQRQDVLEEDASNVNLRDKLKNASPAQIDAWLLNNVTNLAEARVVLGSIVKYLATRLNQ